MTLGDFFRVLEQDAMELLAFAQAMHDPATSDRFVLELGQALGDDAFVAEVWEEFGGRSLPPSEPEAGTSGGPGAILARRARALADAARGLQPVPCSANRWLGRGHGSLHVVSDAGQAANAGLVTPQGLRIRGPLRFRT